MILPVLDTSHFWLTVLSLQSAFCTRSIMKRFESFYYYKGELKDKEFDENLYSNAGESKRDSYVESGNL